MNQKTIDIYHQGQERYRARTINHEVEIIDSHFPASPIRRNIYDFMFNKKWGLAMAIGKWLYDNRITYMIDGHSLEDEHTYSAIAKDLETDILYGMILSDNPVKYLETFKWNKK